MSPSSSLALAVVTRDRAELLGRYLLPSLMQTRDAGVEVLIVDQSGDDATRQLVGGLDWVRLVRGEPGLSRGRNLAVAETSAPIVAFTDDDVEFGADWLRRIEAAFGAPDIGGVCGRGVDSQGVLLPGLSPGIYRWPTNPFGLGHGFNMAFRRTALGSAGAFDERLGAGTPVAAGEDTDMIYRVMRAGWSISCRPDITVAHHSWRSPQEASRTHRNYGIGFAAQTAKHLREGDWTAGRLAIRQVIRQLGWMAYSVTRRDLESFRLQHAWLAGAAAGWREGRRHARVHGVS